MTAQDDPRAVAIRHADDAIAAWCADAAERRRQSAAEAAANPALGLSDYGRAYLDAYIGRLQAIATRLRGERA